MRAVTEYTAKELMAWAGKLNILGRSKMNKAELYAVIQQAMDNCHQMALDEKWERNMAGWEALRHVALKTQPEPVEEMPVPAQPYITVKELTKLTGWKRLPRKYKKAHRAAGHLV